MTSDRWASTTLVSGCWLMAAETISFCCRVGSSPTIFNGKRLSKSLEARFSKVTTRGSLSDSRSRQTSGCGWVRPELWRAQLLRDYRLYQSCLKKRPSLLKINLWQWNGLRILSNRADTKSVRCARAAVLDLSKVRDSTFATSSPNKRSGLLVIKIFQYSVNIWRL